jgi:hypothetical protein
MFQFTCGILAGNVWSNERVVTFIKDLQSSACLWDMHYTDYKNCNKKCDAIDFLAKKYESSTTDIEKKSPISKVSFREGIKKL